ncbi:hypothetical protein BC826DRAFT_158506 [Russula brevipes]|nr:hypothetical protein BC826DRAFT_158506 [Russula brevipes]
MLHKSCRQTPAPSNPKCAAHASTRGNYPCNTGCPPGPPERHTGHASVAQAEATRDTRTRTGVLTLSEAIARTAKGKSPAMNKRALLGTAVSTKSCCSPRRATEKPQEAQKTRPAAQHSTHVSHRCSPQERKTLHCQRRCPPSGLRGRDGGTAQHTWATPV